MGHPTGTNNRMSHNGPVIFTIYNIILGVECSLNSAIFLLTRAHYAMVFEASPGGVDAASAQSFPDRET